MCVKAAADYTIIPDLRERTSLPSKPQTERAAQERNREPPSDGTDIPSKYYRYYGNSFCVHARPQKTATISVPTWLAKLSFH